MIPEFETKAPAFTPEEENELLTRTRSGDRAAETALVRSLMRLVRFAIARDKRMLRIDAEEAHSVALLGVAHALRTHVPSKGALTTCVVTCVQNELARAYTWATRRKRAAELSAVSIDAPISIDKEGQEKTLHDILPSDPEGRDEGRVHARECVLRTLDACPPKERQVMALLYGGAGMDQCDVARALGCSPQYVWSTERRAIARMQEAA